MFFCRLTFDISKERLTVSVWAGYGCCRM